MFSSSHAQVGHLRFLDLPAEVRNMIYGLLLVFPGPTYPTREPPTSVISQQSHMRRRKRDAVPVPKSALEMLCVNRQIHDEARKLFYHDNEFVFSWPTGLQSFLFTLGDGRLQTLRSVTLFHTYYRSYTSEKEKRALKICLFAMRFLPGLRKFHLLVDFSTRAYPFHDQNPAHQGALYPSALPHVEGLFKLKNLSDIACRHLPAEDWKNNPVSQMHPGEDLCSSYRHFTFGLRLAQKGFVNSELYTEVEWENNTLWPVLEGSDCGSKKDCTCGQIEEAPN